MNIIALLCGLFAFIKGIIFKSSSVKINMSQAFVKESEEQWLHEIDPTMTALINYLTRENNGIRVYEKDTQISDKTGKEIHMMSNGLSYAVGEDGRWMIVD